MAQNPKIKEFPEVVNKLAAPNKKSLFERQKAEAEAKRQKEQEETAAVYEDFIKSFDDDAEDQAPSARSGNRGGFGLPPPTAPGGFSKRHFSGAPSGPGGGKGGLGRGVSGPGSLGPPPPSIIRKRTLEGGPPVRDSKHGMFAFEDTVGPVDARTAFQESDDEEEASSKSKVAERAAPKPTLHLSSLPLGSSPAAIKAILPPSLNIDGVKLLPPGPGSLDRRSMSAIVTLAKDTPAVDLDTAVSALQNKYLGWGHYLSLSRHLSSAAISSIMPGPTTLGSTALPFGARPVPQGPTGGLSRAPPPGSHRGGFAPPSSYAPMNAGFSRGAPPVQVNVTPPCDLKQLRLIHKTVESVITHGPEFEALLMSRPSVQKEEKWAWIWDPRSAGGVWYRWRIWDILTGAQRRIRTGRGRNDNASQHVFDGGAVWVTQERALAFEYSTAIDEFVSDSEYDSSEDEDSGDEGRRRLHHLQGGALPPDAMVSAGDDALSYLNPLQKAKLVHLLARLPSTNARLRRGDVARVTAFAIRNAGKGAEEVVQLITQNVHTPFALTSANPDRKTSPENAEERPDGDDNPAAEREKEDPSSLKLIALYLISDILSSSSTSGVRHAWRYRQLFESALRNHSTFAHLGRLEKELAWGRLRAEKWRRSVNSVLSLWEGWCAFPARTQEEFVASFNEPPLTAREKEEKERAEEAERARAKGSSKWKTLDEKAREKAEAEGGDEEAEPDAQPGMDVDVDAELMVDDDVDGEPMQDEDVDGEPMDEDEAEDEEPDGEPMEDEDAGQRGQGAAAAGSGGETTAQENAGGPDAVQAARRRRPKAEDMFADSDDEQ